MKTTKTTREGWTGSLIDSMSTWTLAELSAIADAVLREGARRMEKLDSRKASGLSMTEALPAGTVVSRASKPAKRTVKARKPTPPTDEIIGLHGAQNAAVQEAQSLRSMPVLALPEGWARLFDYVKGKAIPQYAQGIAPDVNVKGIVWQAIKRNDNALDAWKACEAKGATGAYVAAKAAELISKGF